MKMSKKYKRICLAFGLGTALCATAVSAANYTKTITATYRNIGVTYNGASKTLSAEPFLVDGSTYVPLRAVSEIMGANVNWNGTTNTVTITNDASSTNNTALEQQLATANYQVTTLQRELETVKKELETYKSSTSSSSSTATSGTDITTTELENTETYLQNNFANELDEDIDLDFSLAKKSSRLQLTISYSSASEERTYNNDVKERAIKNFVEDVCEAVAERHSGIEIQGTIEYTKSDIQKASFTYSKSGRLTVDYGLDEDDVEDIVFDTYKKLSLPGLTSTTISSVDAKVNSSNSTITFMIYVDASASNFKDTWNENYQYQTSTLRKELKEIRDAIQEETDYDVNGTLYTYSGNILLGQYDGYKNELTLEKMK